MDLSLLSFSLLIGLIGLVIGSFLCIIITRHPPRLFWSWRKECHEYLSLPFEEQSPPNIWFACSHCPKCSRSLPWTYKIPLFGYLFARGRCVFCKKRISWRYPIVESLTALTSFTVAYLYGFTPILILPLLFTFGVIVLLFIDLEHQILPDEITFSVLWLGLMANASSVFTTPSQAILGAGIGYLLLWAFNWIYRFIRKQDGMGYGDFKMMAMVGAWVGLFSMLNALIIAIVLSSLITIGLLVTNKATLKTGIPFGPFIAIGGWITLLTGPWALRFLMSVHL